jgi:hypothetical protein
MHAPVNVFPAQREEHPYITFQSTNITQTGHARYYWLLLAESHLTMRLFGSSMVRRIAALPVVSGLDDGSKVG